jgi:iron complex outermembrane receptor protein
MALVGAGQALAQSQADISAAFRTADKNNDGRLDAAEFGTLPQAIRDKAVDANGDGAYILAELTPSSSATEATEVRAVVSVGTYLKSGSEDTALNIEATSRDDLLKSGSPSMEQLIRGLSETGLNDNGENRGQNLSGTIGVRTINLRNLGAGRTLILFDGVRLADDPQTNGGPGIARDPNAAGGGAQNLNNLPLEVMASVEILKDGGAAAYGGDAAAGAVSFEPRRDLNGLEATFSLAAGLPLIIPTALIGLANAASR